MLISVWSPKGGSGTSSIAAALAIVASGPVRLVDLGDDQPAIFGLASDPLQGVSELFTRSPGTISWANAVDGGAGVELLARGLHSLDAIPETVMLEWVRAWQLAREVYIVDAGGPTSFAARALIDGADVSIAVVQPCYLALRRAVREPRLAEVNGVVVIEDAQRPLRAREVADVLARPVLARVPVATAIARALDAGVFPTRLPEQIRVPISGALRTLDIDCTGRAAS